MPKPSPRTLDRYHDAPKASDMRLREQPDVQISFRARSLRLAVVTGNTSAICLIRAQEAAHFIQAEARHDRPS